jgi:SAM-dependent methyltransferase
MANDYTQRWFGTFLDAIPEEWTTREVEALLERLPLPEFSRVLDVCCGPGRHAGPLAAAGYQITGVDRDVTAISTASKRVPGASFHIHDLRELGSLEGEFDAAMILWQSFGYFDSAINDRILGDIARLVRRGGRLLLDLYHPGFVETHAGTQTEVRAADCRSITNVVDAGRLISTIQYDDGWTESMDFELLDPDDLSDRAFRHGWSLIEACSWWDASRPPSATDQRYQLVLERRTRVT